MAVVISTTTPRGNARSVAEGFVTVQTLGAREVARELERRALAAGRDAPKLLRSAVFKASEPIRKGYKQKIKNVTDNLGKSVATITRAYDGAAVAVTGPRVTGPVGASLENGSGNHAWLIEFGTGARRPGTQGRRTYVNVHQRINGKMRRTTTMNDQQFLNASRGHYFLMGSIREPTRQAKKGSGYPHDFGSENGRMFPVTLHPGKTIAPVQAQHPMEKTIGETNGIVLQGLIAAIRTTIDNL